MMSAWARQRITFLAEMLRSKGNLRMRVPRGAIVIMDKLLMSRRTCPKRGKEFLIENDVPRKLDSKKPSGSVEATRAKAY